MVLLPPIMKSRRAPDLNLNEAFFLSQLFGSNESEGPNLFPPRPVAAVTRNFEVARVVDHLKDLGSNLCTAEISSSGKRKMQ